LFVLFDSNVEPSDDAQYRWLENVLENCSTNVRHRFLFMHHQPIHWEGDGKSPIWEDRYTRLFELLAKYNVHYVFTGHWHGYHREERAGTVFVVNAAGAAILTTTNGWFRAILPWLTSGVIRLRTNVSNCRPAHGSSFKACSRPGSSQIWGC